MVSKQLISIASVLAFAAGGTSALAQSLGTAFTYQGELSAAGAPANGTFDLRFRLFDAASGGNQIGATLCSDDINVANGRFAASLDFGAVFTGQMRFLEIEVRADTGLDCSDETDFTALVPLQELTAAPNAAFSLSADSSNTATNALNLGGTPPSSIARLDGNQTFTGQLNFTHPSNTFQGIFSGNGEGLTTLNGGNIAPGTITRSRMSSDIESVLSQWVAQPSMPTGPVDAIAWGDNAQAGQTDVPALPPGMTYTAAAAGVVHNLALRSDGMVIAWGSNEYAQTDVPALPAGLMYTAVAAGQNHSLALRSDGTIAAWGDNGAGQTDVPALPPGMTYTAVASGYLHSLALRSDGTIVAWGYNDEGQTNVPALPGGVTCTALAGGRFLSLALLSDGTIVAWGYDYGWGLLNVPPLPSGVTYTAVAAGYLHSLALRSDGTVVVWGNDTGLGLFSVPPLPSGVTYTAVAAGSMHSLALRSDGTVVAWGYDTDGQTDVPALPTGLIYSGLGGGGIRHSLAIRSLTTPSAPRLTSALGISIGTTTPAPAGGLNVIGPSTFSGSVSALSFTGSGAGLTNLNAANLTGSVPSASLTSLPAENLVGNVPAATLTNVPAANLTGSVPATSLTSVPAESLTGSVPSASLTSVPAVNLWGSIPAATLTNVPAANLTGSVPFAALTQVPAANLVGTVPPVSLQSVPAGSLTGNINPANLTSVPAANLTGVIADARLTGNVAMLNGNQTFTGTKNFTGNVGIGTAASQAMLDVRGSGNFRNGHVAYFQNNDATGSGIAIQINATRTTARNNFATFYNGAGAVVGRIEGFDLQAGDWVPPPGLPLAIANGFDSLRINSGVTVRPAADWFNPGSLPSASLQGGRLPSSSLVGGRLPSSSLVGGRLPSSSLDGGSPPSLSINWTAFTFNFNPGSFPALNFDPGAFPTLAFDPGAFPTLVSDPGEFPTLAFNAGTLPSVSSPITLSTPSIGFTLPTEADIMPLTTWAVESNLQGLIAITPMQAAVNVMSVAAMRAAKDGGITYGSKGADYAEYLMKVDPKDTMGFGEVVGIFGGRISRKTDGAERVMVISQAPAVVGNQPPDAERSAYEMVAFMGQVPVAVVGGAKVGDFIAASGQGNGVAVAIHPADLRPEHMERIVGRAWADSVDDRFDFINTHIGAKEEAAAMLLDREIQKNAAAATASEALRAQNQEIMARLKRVEELLSKRQH